MLSSPARAAWLAIVPSTRSLPFRTIGAVIAAASTPMLWNVARGRTDLAGAVIVAGIVGASALGFAVEDPAAELLSAVPVPLSYRRLVRVAVVTAAVVGAWLILGLLVEARDPAGLRDPGVRAAEVVAVAAVALGVAGMGERNGNPGSGSAGAVAGPIAILTVTALAMRIHGLPSVGRPPHHQWWWVLAAAGALAALWSSRDPAT